jgi:lysophospholipase L1-like esterase
MRSARRFTRLVVALALACAALPASAQDFHLKDGDRVVFYGDSITAQRLYSARVEEYVLTRFPSMRVAFFHAGVGGDRVSGGGAGPIDARLTRDVIRMRPTVVTIMLGMNDAGYRPFDQAIFDEYARGYRHILDRLQQELPGVRLTLIQPSPFDDVTRDPTFDGGYNAVLRRYADFVATLGRERGALVVDFNTPVVRAMERLGAANTQLARQILPDRVHPGEAGHWIMAEALLRAWRAPAVVSAVEIDAAMPAIVSAQGTTVTGLAKTQTGLAWTAHDAALPLPQRFDDGIMEIVKAAGGGIADLGRQTIVVKNLAPGRYRVVIDDGAPGRLATAEELAAGVELGGTQTPMVWQAMGVRWATEDKNVVHEQVMNALVRSAKDPDQAETARRLEAVEATLTADREAARHPVPRRFSVTLDEGERD